MATLSLGHLSSLWKQHLLSEFAGLKQACPEGVFVSMNPGDPALWSAVLFVRDGPYAPAVLRFHISFPDSYPRSPPLVTFQTDMFHPLITPLTTHMYTTDLQDGGLGVPAEQEMLPPGGFSLRHGFPEWYDRDKQTTAANGGSSSSSSKAIPVQSGGRAGQVTPPLSSSSSSSLPQQTPQQTPQPQPQPQPQSQSQSQGGSLPRYMQTDRRSISTYSILKYIRSTFDKEDILDSMPLSATGNPGAWHAWRTHRRKQGKVFPDDPSSTTASYEDGGSGGGGGEASEGEEKENAAEQHDEEGKSEETTPKKAMSPTSMTRRPEDWNWDGVWEDRVKKGIASTLSESVLYGAVGGSDSLIHFLALEDGDIQTVKENLRRTLGAPV